MKRNYTWLLLALGATLFFGTSAWGQNLVGLQTQFSGSSLPDGWQMNELGEPGYAWYLQGNMIWINSFQNEGHHVAGELISPVIDCSEMEVVLLGININYFFYPFPAGMTDAEIRYSTDGQQWHTFYTFTQSVGSTGFPYHEWDLSEVAAGENSFYLKFWFDDQDVQRAFWQIESVIVYAPTVPEIAVEPDTGSLNFGVVLLEESSEPQQIRISNTGIGHLLVEAPQLNDNTHYSLIYDASDFPAALQFGEYIDFEVVFHPLEGGPQQTTLSFAYTDSSANQYSIVLIGEGYDPTITSFPYTEIFQQFEFPALGWRYVQGVEGAYWQGTGVSSHTGSRSVRTYFGPSSGNQANEWLLTPPLDLDQSGAELLYFYVYSNFDGDSITNKLEIWILPDYYDNVEALEANGEMIAEVYVNNQWERRSVDIRDYQGIRHFAFRYRVDAQSGWRLVYLDNVNIDVLETVTLTMLEPSGDEGRVHPGVGEHAYFFGEEASLSADAGYAWGWEFEKWEVNGSFYSDQPEISLMMEANMDVQAFFAPVDPIWLTVQGPEGQGSTLPVEGSHAYKQGTRLSVGAYPDQGWAFTHWEKNGAVFSEDNPLLITLDEAHNLKAVFEQGLSYQLSFGVYDQQASPLTQAIIRVNETENTAGNYEFAGLYPGQYHYSVTSEGYIPTGGSLHIANQDVLQNVTLEEAYGELFAVHFSVSDEEGLDVEDALIMLNGYANLSGQYAFSGFPSGTYTFRVLRSGYLPFEGQLQLEGQDLDVSVGLLSDNRLLYEDFAFNVQPGGWAMVVHGEQDQGWTFQEEKARITPDSDLFVSASLVSPAVDVSEALALGLRMHHFYNPYTRTRGEIRLSHDGLTWQTIALFRDEAEGDLFMSMEDYYLSGDFAFGQQVYLAFYYAAVESLNGYFNWQIDDLELYDPVPYAFEANRYGQHVYAANGSPAVHKLQIRNTGALQDTYLIQQLDGSWDYSFEPEITLSGGALGQISLHFDVPQGLNMGTRDSLLLRISSLSDPQLFHDVVFIAASVGPIFDDYFEDFDIVGRPSLPGGWSRIRNTSTSNANVATAGPPHYTAYSAPNLVRLNNSSDLEAELVLISPPVDEQLELSAFRTRLWLKNSASAPLLVGTMDDPQGSFTPLAEWVSDNHFTWQEFMLGFENYQGTDRYIAFKQKVVNTNSHIQIDDVFIEIIPPPIFTISADAHDFGEGWLNYLNDSLQISITNKGHYEVLLHEIAMGAGDDFYVQLPELPVALEYNEVYSFMVYFHPHVLGDVSDQILIQYTADTPQEFAFQLSGTVLPRPRGSTCEDPIFVDLPLVDYAGSTEQFGRDYLATHISPGNWYMHGNDMVLQFSLSELSLLSGHISGPRAAVFILESCPSASQPAQVLAGAISGTQFESFENVLFNAGTYFAIVSSNHVNPPFHTNFVVNLSSIPMPAFHHVNFLVTENAEDPMPLPGARIHLLGDYMSGNIYTGPSGQVSAEIVEGEYQASVFLPGYLKKEMTLSIDGPATIHIRLTDQIFDPSALEVDTENQAPGQALLSWNAKPAGEPFVQGFEGSFPPSGWEQIINNPGGLDPESDGADWKFSWQQYGTVYFSDNVVIPKEGEKHAFVHWSTQPQDEWLITHEFEAPADDLEFWYFGRNGNNNQDFFVKVSTDNGQSWTPLWNASDLPMGVNYYAYPAIIDLSYYAGVPIRLAWNAVGPNGLISSFMVDAIRVGDMKIDTRDLITHSATGSRQDYFWQPLAVNSSREMRQLPAVKAENMMSVEREISPKVLSSFDVYLDDMVIPVATGLQNTQHLYMHLPVGDYMAGVRARYTTGDSELITQAFTITVGDDGSTVNETEQVPVRLFPNPASDYIEVHAGILIRRIRLIGMSGEQHLDIRPDKESVRISVGHLPSGVYQLRLFGDETVYEKRIQIIR